LEGCHFSCVFFRLFFQLFFVLDHENLVAIKTSVPGSVLRIMNFGVVAVLKVVSHRKLTEITNREEIRPFDPLLPSPSCYPWSTSHSRVAIRSWFGEHMIFHWPARRMDEH